MVISEYRNRLKCIESVVPELWRVYKKTVRIYLFSGESYTESTTSRAFPFVTGQTLSEFLTLGLAEGGRKSARAFRSWLREQKQLRVN